MRLTRAFVVLALIPCLTACRLRPTAYPDDVVATRGVPIDISVLANDTDPRDRPLTLEYTSASAKGSASINPDQTIRYTPNINASGQDVFTYRIKNTRGRTSTAEVSVTIQEPAPRPLAAAPSTPPVPQPAPTGSSQPPGTTPPPPPVPPILSAGATINAIAVTIFTREDDKDAGETVQVTLKRGADTISQRTIGGPEAWARHTDRTEEFEVIPPIANTLAKDLALEVRKVSSGGAGEGWVMQIDVQGRLSDGRTVSLVPKTLPFRFGGGSSNSRSWAFAPVTAP